MKPAAAVHIIRHIIFVFSFLVLPVRSGLVAQENPDTLVIQETAPVDETDEENDYGTDEEPAAYFLKLGESDTISPFRQRIPATEMEALKKQKAFWYANREINYTKDNKPDSSGTEPVSITRKPWFNTLMWIIILAAFIAVIIFYLSESQFSLFRRNRNVEAAAVTEPEEMPEDIFAIQYPKEIHKAIQQNNFRLAVRLHYLQLLKTLAARSVIRYQQDKTNLDYLQQLYKTPYYDLFFQVTRHYEYSWYGHFDVTADAYRMIREDFEKIENNR